MRSHILTPLLVIFTFCLQAGALRAQEFAPAIGRTGIGRCHMDTCSFFIIEDAKPVGPGKGGTLFAVATKEWQNEYKAQGDDDNREYDRPPVKLGEPTVSLSFVFCSKTRPIEFFYQGSRWASTRLRPGDERAMAGALEYAYVFYWATCHNYITKDATSVNMALKLGYRFKDQPEDPSIFGDSNGNIQPMDVLR